MWPWRKVSLELVWEMRNCEKIRNAGNLGDGVIYVILIWYLSYFKKERKKIIIYNGPQGAGPSIFMGLDIQAKWAGSDFAPLGNQLQLVTFFIENYRKILTMHQLVLSSFL